MKIQFSRGWCGAISVLGSVVFLASVGCGKSDSPGSFPSITPPLKAVTPSGLGGTAALTDTLADAFSDTFGDSFALAPSLDPLGPVHRTLSISSFKTDFFTSGPTYLFGITANVDNRINFFNTSSTNSGCLSAAPIAYTITPAGQSAPVTMYAQCYQKLTSGFTGDPGLIMIGKKNGITYVWDANGASWVAAIATPDGNSFDIHAWYSVGIGNGITGASGGTCGTVGDFAGCSYGVAEVSTTASTNAFEMAAAGIGVGYCGVQFISDGTDTWGTGSAGPSCQVTDSVCLSSADETNPENGSICQSMGPFKVTTPIGIAAGSGAGGESWGNSGYPNAPNVTLNGTSTDSVHFGPTQPPAGVAQF